MPLKFNPYLVEWIVLPEGANITDEELHRAAAEVAAKAGYVSVKNADGTFTHTLSFPGDDIGEPWPPEKRSGIECR